MNVVIIEDEAAVARRIARLVQLVLGQRLQRLDLCTNLTEARQVLASRPPDLLLLDLNLNGRDGFDLLTPLLAESFHVIVVSAYKDMALRAFEYGMLDFVPKPVDLERLRQAFGRLDRQAEATRSPVRRLALKHAGRTEFIALDDVVSFHGASDYSEILLRSGRTMLCDKSLDTLASLLGGEFRRIHRSHIVRRADIVALRSAEGSRYLAELSDGRTLVVSRSRIKAIREELSS